MLRTDGVAAVQDVTRKNPYFGQVWVPQLRAKISSKFQTSTFLAGFGLAVLTLQVATFWQAAKFPCLLLVSISIMMASICIYIAAVVKLDEITMPKRFWQGASNRGQAPSAAEMLAYLKDDDLWELQKRMVFYWWRLTAVATSLTGGSLLLMMLPPFTPCDLTTSFIKEETPAWILWGVDFIANLLLYP
jgi:hypothetical protein